jgi:hypothetical protein
MNIGTNSGPENHWQTVKARAGHLWPTASVDLKARVVLAFMLLAKLINLGRRLSTRYEMEK